ncbi:MAG: flagellar motor switch protein FliG [Planctomycetota bacterium]
MAEEFTGIDKVATFLLSLDADAASAVLKHIDQEILTEVAEAMTRIDPTIATQKKISELKRGFAIESTGPLAVKPKNESELGEFLKQGVGVQESRNIVDRLRNRKLQEHPFLELEALPASDVTRALSKESPAVCSLILAHIDPALSATILSSFEPDDALGIVKRMTSLVPPGLDILRSIAQRVLETIGTGSDGPVEVNPEKRLQTIASMLNFSATETEQTVLQGIADDDEETAEGIREYMFAWNDLADIDKRSMQKILGSVDTRTLSISLKACQPDIENNIMANLSSRVRDMVAEERELAGAMPLSEVLAARSQVMTTVRGMIESGEFSPARSGEEMVT